MSFETYPHAIACAFLGKDIASAKLKRIQRRQLLEDAGTDTKTLRSIDAVDAALCALTARHLLKGEARAYGDAQGGYLQVPVCGSRSVLTVGPKRLREGVSST